MSLLITINEMQTIYFRCRKKTLKFKYYTIIRIGDFKSNSAILRHCWISSRLRLITSLNYQEWPVCSASMYWLRFAVPRSPQIACCPQCSCWLLISWPMCDSTWPRPCRRLRPTWTQASSTHKWNRHSTNWTATRTSMSSTLLRRR